MKTTAFLLIAYGVAVVTLVNVVSCAPMDGRGTFIAIACSQLCPDVNHPVCAVDAQGLPKTFANRCFVDFAYCREGKYYVIMKEGEHVAKVSPPTTRRGNQVQQTHFPTPDAITNRLFSALCVRMYFYKANTIRRFYCQTHFLLSIFILLRMILFFFGFFIFPIKFFRASTRPPQDPAAPTCFGFSFFHSITVFSHSLSSLSFFHRIPSFFAPLLPVFSFGFPENQCRSSVSSSEYQVASVPKEPNSLATESDFIFGRRPTSLLHHHKVLYFLF